MVRLGVDNKYQHSESATIPAKGELNPGGLGPAMASGRRAISRRGSGTHPLRRKPPFRSFSPSGVCPKLYTRTQCSRDSEARGWFPTVIIASRSRSPEGLADDELMPALDPGPRLTIIRLLITYDVVLTAAIQ